MKVPILLNYDYTKVLGYIEIAEELLPENTNWSLQPGWRLHENGYTLVCVSMEADR